MKTVSKVIQYFENLYSGGAIYVYGANAQVITPALCNSLFKKYGNSTYTQEYYNNKLAEGLGKIGADCSGAFYPMSGTDLTAQNYYNQCSIKGNVTYLDRSVACLVFKGGTAASIHHIGFYCGNGYVIEMRSSKENCVKSKLDGGGWNFFGVPKWINYTVAEPVYGVDLSANQGKVDFNALKSSGIKFVLLRTILKSGATDPMYAEYLRQALATEMKVGVYFYSYDTTEMAAITSAQKVIALLDGRKVPIFYDLEDKTVRAKGSGVVTATAKAFIQTCEKFGYHCYIYCNHDWYNNVLSSSIKPYALWIAKYGANNGQYNIAYKPNCGEKIWQYTSAGRLNGIQGKVDLDICYDMSIFDDQAIPAKETWTETNMNIMGIIKGTGVRIRQEPTTDSAILGSYSNELVQLIAQTSNNWYKTKKGYVSGNYVKILKGKVVNCNKVNVRQLADKNSLSLEVIPADELVYIIVGLGDWFNVLTDRNIVGWIKKDYIELQI